MPKRVSRTVQTGVPHRAQERIDIRIASPPGAGRDIKTLDGSFNSATYLSREARVERARRALAAEDGGRREPEARVAHREEGAVARRAAEALDALEGLEGSHEASWALQGDRGALETSRRFNDRMTMGRRAQASLRSAAATARMPSTSRAPYHVSASPSTRWMRSRGKPASTSSCTAASVFSPNG